MGNSTSQNFMSFQDQMKKNRPTPKLNDFSGPSGSTLLNQNPMRNMPIGPVNSSAANASAARRPITSPQQVLLSSDDEIMDDSVHVGK